MDYGLVSVIIPTYNRFDYCCRAIESVLAQTYQNFEIVVVDDASTDPQYDNNKLESYPKTKVIHLNVNMRTVLKTKAAQGATRDIGIENSNGVWIAFLDDDDVWLPEKLATQLTELQKAPGVLMSCTNYYKDKPPYDPTKHTKPIYDECVNFLTYDVGKTVTSSMLVHREIVKKIGHHKIIPAEDHNYWLRAMYISPVLYIGTPLVVYDNVHSLGVNYYYEYKGPS